MLNKLYLVFQNSRNAIDAKESLFKKVVFLPIIIALILGTFLMKGVPALAATTNYGIMIADNSGHYTYYDFNSETSSMEISKNGKASVSAWSFASKIPEISYSYNKSTGKATLKNSLNGKKVIFTKNQMECVYYKGRNAAPIIKKLSAPMYISKKTSSVMVPAAALALLMPPGGYQYLNQTAMQEKAYDTYDYSGCFVYHPYNKITSIPDATDVKGISRTIRVTIPEGYAAPQIFELLVKKGVCTSTDLLFEACNSYEFSYYPLVKEIIPNENRCFRLEGYLFPDTYEFYRMSSGQDAIGKFLRNTEQKITEKDKERATELGYSIDEVLTIASIIEKECGIHSQQPSIAAVIHNRLSIGMKLQMDACDFYLTRYIKPNVSSEDLVRYKSTYDTYETKALPAGPICNPGRRAINAALYPSDISALFFCSDVNGNYYFAATKDEHDANLAAIKSSELQD